mmetsp:Transcript_23932/g.50426  ORF Transcript_23932/g.50426 Transcript_23932/m.50426 type:complete len:417 (+) Transcript_23932:66-1316(+)
MMYPSLYLFLVTIFIFKPLQLTRALSTPNFPCEIKFFNHRNHRTHSPSNKPRQITRRESLQQILIFASASIPLLPPTISNAQQLATEEEGIPLVTNSPLGKSIRRTIIQSARVADTLDEQWESFSDKLRDKSRCDEVTGRRLYDNGKRKDGSSIGNPGLGELCEKRGMESLDAELGKDVLGMGVESALIAVANGGKGKEALEKAIQQTKELVRPSFERSIQNSMDNEGERKRKMYNYEFYSTLRAIDSYLTENGGGKESTKQFQTAWGRILVETYAPNASRKDYVSPFPEKEDEFQDYDYDKGSLLDALGKLTVVLDRFKSGGLIGYYEISIPYDDYGSVVTVAIDDYVPIGAEILLKEQNYSKCDGPLQSMIRYLFSEARIGYALNSFFIDPSTTRQSGYNPTQLLLSLNGLTKM